MGNKFTTTTCLSLKSLKFALGKMFKASNKKYTHYLHMEPNQITGMILLWPERDVRGLSQATCFPTFLPLYMAPKDGENIFTK